MPTPYAVPFLPQYKYGTELIATAQAMAAPGKGILAADESIGTIGKRLSEINAENNLENRRAYRSMLFSARNLAASISGVILFEETLYDKDEAGKDLVAPLREAGILLGIKVDLGTKPIPGCDNETYTQGLTDLDKRCSAYYQAGCRFAKWRAVLRISPSTPSLLAIEENANTLAKYAAICQSQGLVPIVESEILMDGEHSLEICQYWTEHVISSCYRALNAHHVLLEGTLLKPNMCLPGKQFKSGKVSVEQRARATVEALLRTVPPAVPAVAFLSGGQSEEEATAVLNAINALPLGIRPWRLTFSFARALQRSAMKSWGAKKENVPTAQAVLLQRACANSAASLGKYAGEAASATVSETSYVQDYKY